MVRKGHIGCMWQRSQAVDSQNYCRQLATGSLSCMHGVACCTLPCWWQPVVPSYKSGRTVRDRSASSSAESRAQARVQCRSAAVPQCCSPRDLVVLCDRALMRALMTP